MTDLTPALIAGTASLLAAGLAATVSLVVSMLAKEQKTSEFRQQWINDVREDVAATLSELLTLREFARIHQGTSISDEIALAAIKERYANIVAGEKLVQRLKLRLNPREHTKLLELLERLSKYSRSDTDMDEVARQIVSESQAILKTEWQRVKKGEPAYFWSKRIAIGVIFVSVLVPAQS